MSSLIQLECRCNNYPWGKKGKESLAAQYAASTPGGCFKLDESKEYAEVSLSMPLFCFSFPRFDHNAFVLTTLSTNTCFHQSTSASRENSNSLGRKSSVFGYSQGIQPKSPLLLLQCSMLNR
jgi:hypothetical protein